MPKAVRRDSHIAIVVKVVCRYMEGSCPPVSNASLQLTACLRTRIFAHLGCVTVQKTLLVLTK